MDKQFIRDLRNAVLDDNLKEIKRLLDELKEDELDINFWAEEISPFHVKGYFNDVTGELEQYSEEESNINGYFWESYYGSWGLMGHDYLYNSDKIYGSYILWTFLHWIGKMKKKEIFEIFVSYGADPNFKDVVGTTPNDLLNEEIEVVI